MKPVCKKQGCTNLAAAPYVYCSIECSPYGLTYSSDYSKPKTLKRSRLTVKQKLDKIRELAAKGMTRKEIAETMGLGYSSVVHLTIGSDIDIKRQRKI